MPGKNAAPYLYQMIKDLQHRGQAGAGISTYDPGRSIIIRKHKKPGKVTEVFGGADEVGLEEIMANLEGEKGIGHTRYGTSGSLTNRHVQPFERVHGIRHKWFTFGFNGHIANRAALEERIRKEGYHLMLDTDTEVLMHYLSKYISEINDAEPKEMFRRLSEDFDGAYNVAFLDATGNLIAMRDPWGIRPLSAVQTDEGAHAASESCALYRFRPDILTHVRPGEMAVLEGGELRVERYCPPKRKALCFFEFLYFANVTSEIDGRSVYEARKSCGEELARIEDQQVNDKDWVVIPVPDTARPIANSYAKALGFPQIFDEGLIAATKGRTFIDGGKRSKKVMNKFLPIPSVIRGKKVIVVDDSIVRSTTMATMVKYHLKRIGGASEVHVRIATPPIIAPCYYGIDMRTFDELIAAPYEDRIDNGVMDGAAQEEIAERIDADSLKYLTHEGLLRALGFDRSEICMACLDRRYPTPAGKTLDEAAHGRFEKRLRADPKIGCGFKGDG